MNGFHGHSGDHGDLFRDKSILFHGADSPSEVNRQYTPRDAFYFLGQRAPYEASRQYTPHDAFYFLGQRASYDASRQYTPHDAFYFLGQALTCIRNYERDVMAARVIMGIYIGLGFRV